MSSTDDLVAAPADDGGHQGSFTVPSDELQTPDGEPRHPPTDQDPARPGGDGNASSAFGWGVAFVVVVLAFLGVYGFAC
jgi:hypothetical protein